jgi:hypothetical protein
MLITDISEHDPIMGLFKGESGTGKTTAACTFPGPIKIWSLDNRMKSVAMYLKRYFPRKDIEVLPYGMNDFVPFLDNFGKAAEPYSPEACFTPTGKKIATFICDGLTSLATMIIAYSLSMRSSTHTSGKDELSRGVIKLPEIDDYKAEHNALVNILSYARQINKFANFIMTAHVIVSRQYDIIAKQHTESRSLLTGGSKVASLIPVYFDEIWHFDVDTVLTDPSKGTRSVYIARTQHAGRDFARTALPLPASIDWTDGLLWPKVEKFLPPKPKTPTEEQKPTT